MPVETGAADRHHRRAIVLLVIGVRGLFQQRHMAGHAVVVIEEAVADENFGLREIGAKACYSRFGLRQRHGRPGRHPAGRRQHDEEPPDTSRHISFPCIGLVCGSLSRHEVLSRHLGRPRPAPCGLRLCRGGTRSYLLAWAMPTTVCAPQPPRQRPTGATAMSMQSVASPAISFTPPKRNSLTHI